MKLSLLEHQPKFPEVDLTDSNATFFELILQNEAMVDSLHQIAENDNFLYLLVHRAITNSSDKFPDTEGYRSMQFGMKAYEITGSMVTNGQNKLGLAALNIVYMGVEGTINSSKFVDYLVDARDRFKDNQPITTEMITQASSRFFPNKTDYAVMGAAIERQTELEAREAEVDVQIKQIEYDLGQND